MERDVPDVVTCFHCNNARISRGSWGSYYVQPDPPEASCRVGDRDSTVQDDIVELMGLWCVPENAARFCPHFVAVCKICGTVMRRTEDVYDVGGVFYDEYPACSMLCLEALNRDGRRYFNGFMWAYD